MRLMRAFRAGFGELRAFFPRLWSIFRELLNEVVGLVFLAIALFFTVSANGLIQTFQTLDEDPEAITKFLIVLGFVVLFAWFGISSFRRARRIARQR